MFCSLIRNVRADPKSIFGHFSAPALAQTFTTYSWIGNSTCNPLLTAICGPEASVRFTVEARPARRPCKTRDGAEHNEAMRVFLRMHQAAKHGLLVGTETQQGRKKVRIGSWKGSLHLTYLSANRHTLENTTTLRELHSRASLSRQGSPIHLAVRCPPSAT